MQASLAVAYLGHATTAIELDGVRLLTDPVLCRRVWFLRRQGPDVDPTAYAGCDAVLLSHSHPDHAHGPSLDLVGRATRVLAPPRLARRLRRRGFERVEAVTAGESAEVGGVVVTATPTVHRDSEGVGYLVERGGRAYFAGDTDLFPEMARLAGDLDLALLPVGGWGPTVGPGHLDPRRAAAALALLRPRVAIPIHWGTLRPVGAGRIRPRYLTEPPTAFARHAARLAPEVHVRVLPRGGAVDLSR